MTTPHTTSADIAEAVCQAVAELGDRNSPADWPEAMLVTGDELHLIVTDALAASAPVAPTQPASITLDFKQATELLGMYGGEPTEVTLMVGNGHSGKGVYAHWTSVPEEGAMFLGASDDEAAPVAPAPMHAVPNLTLEPEMRAAMQAVFDAESVPVRPAPLTDTFVQAVPDKCDRIVWRNNYYHLPIAATPKADHSPEAGKMLGDLLARIHGDGGHYASEHGIEKAVADADRILAEWRAYKPAPLQQGEHLPLPECDATTIGLGQVWNRHSMRAYVDADRAARGQAPAQPALALKPLQWSDEREPNEDVRYNHVVAESPLGRITIEWKGWKKYDSRCVYVGGEYIDSGNTLEDAKKIAECHLQNVVEALTTAAPAPVAEDAANWHWLASYLVGPRTDLDDEIVASESVNDLRKLVSAARAKAAQPEGGAKT